MISMKKMEVYAKLIGGVYRSVVASKIEKGAINNMHWMAQDANGDTFLYRKKPQIDIEHGEWLHMGTHSPDHSSDFNCIGSSSQSVPNWQDTLIYIGA